MAEVKFAGEEAVERIAHYVNKKLNIASTMPSTPNDEDIIILYVGESTESYIQGCIYKYDEINEEWKIINSVQTVELTTAEYESLPVSVQNNGTIYFLTDGEGGGGNKDNSNLAPIEVTTTASRSYLVGDYLMLQGKFYKVISAIAIGDTLTVGTNIQSTNVGDEIVEVNDVISYSTNEHKVGKWIDGSDLYEKTFSIKNPSSGISSVATLVGEIVAMQGISRRTDGIVFQLPYFYDLDHRIYFAVDTNNILKMEIEGYTISEAIITVRYIKN